MEVVSGQRSAVSHVLFAALWIYFLFFHGLGKRDLWNSHEARAAMDARSVLDGHQLLPELNDGTPELQKPPLYYWMVAAIAALTGEVDAWAVRLPAAVSAVLCLVVVVWFGRTLGRRREGLTAAFLLATALHFTWLARVGRIDMPLTLTTTAALASFYLAENAKPRLPFLLIAYLSLGCSLLLKGPIGVVLVGAALGTYFLMERRWPRGLGLWWGAPLMLAIALPWFIVADRATGGELGRVFFWHHNVERGLGGSSLRGHPWWFYGPRFFLDFAPWGLLLPPCLLWFFRNGRWREDRAARFGLAWLVGMTVLLSCVRYKRADYLVPAYPGAALFLACVLQKALYQPDAPAREDIPRWRVGLVCTTLMLVSALGWWLRVDVYLPRFEPQREQHCFAHLVLDLTPQTQSIVLFQMEGHLLAHHLGRPVRVLRDWHELDILPAPVHVVMPASQGKEWTAHLRQVELEELARNIPGHEKPMVLFRLRPRSATTKGKSQDAVHARPAEPAADRQRAAQSRAAGR